MTAQRPPPTLALGRAARALRLSFVLHGLTQWLALSGGAFLTLLVLDELLHLPQALRLPLAVVLAGFSGVGFYRRVWRPAVRPLSPARAARLLEINQSIADNLLINAHQFESQRSDPRIARFAGQIIGTSGTVLGGIPVRSLWLTPSLRKWFFGALAIAACWLVLVLVFPRYVGNGLERILLPLADIPPMGRWSVAVTPAGPVHLVEGDRLDIVATLRSQLGLAGSGPAPTPQIVWQDSSESPDASGGERAAMTPTGRPDEFAFSFSAVSRPFRFHVAVEDSRSRSVAVDVAPLPQVKDSTFEMSPPPYTGLKPSARPGPPETIAAPVGSVLTARVRLSPTPPAVLWRAAGATLPLAADGDGWKWTQTVKDSSDYDLLATLPGGGPPRVLGSGQVTAIPDRPPEVDFVTDNRNVAVNPGGTLRVTVRATDDYGVASIALRVAPGDDTANTRVLKNWRYLGPPGQPEPAPESFIVPLDPAVFTPGATFLLTAQAADFSPAGQTGTSRPILLHVAGIQDMTVPQGDPLEKLFELLRNTVAAQGRANGLTDNLRLHLAEAIAAGDLSRHQEGMSSAQKQAQDLGLSAFAEAGQHPEGAPYVPRLQALARGEMDLASGQINQLGGVDPKSLDAPLAALQKRQAYILNQLIALLGQMAGDRQQAAEALAKKADPTAPVVTATQEMGKLKDELKAFSSEQKRIIDASHAFRGNPEDLTAEQQEVLGQLARDEAKAASFFQEKLTDLSKLPLQDFGDGKIVSDMNEVYQEVQKASEALYQKRAEIAVPAEQAGLEKASEIEQNLERWLPNTPDNTKWSMEEPANQPTDVPLAELPKQLDDLVGDLLNKEQQMDPDKDDVSSSIMDSLDKGAGWGAGDGPMSNMSAKGVTGNQLPNNMEIGGRSGEGRNGKSDGEMVGNTAVGKGGNETPTRMTSTPFENGSVADQSHDTKGGATGGGKLAGFGQDGLRGPVPPTPQQRVQMLAQQQSQLRQQAESLALQLRQERRPTGDLESAVLAMKEVEHAARTEDGLGLVQGYHQALDALTAAHASYEGERLSRVEADHLAHETQTDVNEAAAEPAPAGYEEMTGAYFRSLGNAANAPPDAPSPATGK